MKIRFTSQYKKDRKLCKKRHYDIKFLDDIITSYVDNNGFNEEDAKTYYDHPLSGNWKGYRSFHPYGHNDDWIVIYHVEGDTVVLDKTGDDSTMVLDRTGTHSDIYGETKEVTMKITASKRDDILRQREEYDAETKRLENIEEEGKSKWEAALYEQKQALEKRVSDLIGSTSINLIIDVNPWGYYGSDSWSISIRANEGGNFKDNVALVWNWEVKLDKDGNVVKDSGSWSGLKATTTEQIDDLVESVRILKILNTTDWSEILRSPKAQWGDYVDKGITNSILDRKNARPKFEDDLQAAQLEDLIGGNTAIKLKQDQYYRGQVWILPTGLTDKFIKGYIFPDYQVDKYTVDDIKNTYGEERRTARTNIIVNNGELITREIAQ